jgi:hypothetical protein
MIIFFLDDRALFFYHVWLYSSVVGDGFGKDSKTQISGESLLNRNGVLLSPLPVPTRNLNELIQGKTTLINNAINNVDSIYNGDRDDGGVHLSPLPASVEHGLGANVQNGARFVNQEGYWHKTFLVHTS